MCNSWVGSCESVGPSPKHDFTDRKPNTPLPFLSSAPDETQTAERSAWTHMMQKNSHSIRFMSTFFFFHLSETSGASSALQHVLFSLSKKFLSAFFCELTISGNKWTVNVFPASVLCSYVLTSTFSTFNQLCVCVKRTEKAH